MFKICLKCNEQKDTPMFFKEKNGKFAILNN